MTDFPPPSLALDATTLLSHSAWLAKFARALVANEADIDDVVQQTLATALARPPRHTGNLRGWLGTVAKNVVRSAARSDTARAAREVALPPPPPVESPVEAVARAELRRKVVECVLALDEPYRSTVILRFFEEQEVAAIARLTKTGEDTVRTRIRRGVLRVRELLERRVDEETRGTAHEGVAAQALLLSRLRDIAASADRPSIAGDGGAHGSSAVSRGFGRTAALQTTRRVLVGAAVVAAAGAGWWWWEKAHREFRVTDAAAARVTPVSDAAPLAAANGSSRTPDVARSVEPTPALAPPPPKRAARTGRIHGIVKDRDGNPVSDAFVWAIPSSSHQINYTMPEFSVPAAAEANRPSDQRAGDIWIATRSGAGGIYEFTDLSTIPGWSIGAYDQSVGATVTDIHSFDREHVEHEVDVPLIPGLVIRGKVHDEDGVPIGNALLTFVSRCPPRRIGGTIRTKVSGDSVGQFDFGFYCGDLIEFDCKVPGFLRKRPTKIEIKPHATAADLDITMQRRPGTIVRGRIVDTTGLPLALEPFLVEHFAARTPEGRAAKAAVFAVGSEAVSRSTTAVDDSSKPVEGRIDYVKGQYEVVVHDGFRGALELRIADAVVGTVPLRDLARAPDLPCDTAKVPKESVAATFAVRFVDAESKDPIDLSHERYLPQGSNGERIIATIRDDGDPRKGVVRYGCDPGPILIEAEISGHAVSIFPVDTSQLPGSEPLTLEIPRARGGVHGVARHADGSPFGKAPIAAYRVTTQGLIATHVHDVVSNPDGEFEFDALAKGEHVFVVSGFPDEAPGVVRFVAAESFPDIEARCAVGVPARFHVAPPLAEGRPALHFQILDHDGIPVENLWRAWRPDSDAIDEFTATLCPGRYTAIASRTGFHERRVDFDAPASDKIDVVLEPLESRPR